MKEPQSQSLRLRWWLVIFFARLMKKTPKTFVYQGFSVFFWQGQKDSPVCGARNSLVLPFAQRISTAAPAFGSLFPLFVVLTNAPHDSRFWRPNPFVLKTLISSPFSTPQQLLTPSLTTKQVKNIRGRILEYYP